MSLKSQFRDPSLKSLPEDLCSEFLRPEKIHQPQPGLNPRTLDLEAITLPRDHRGRLLECYYEVFPLHLWNYKCTVYYLFLDKGAELRCKELWKQNIP